MGKLSNYPTGVTGNEYEIAGPNEMWEEPAPHRCPECDWNPPDDDDDALVTFERYESNVWWTCPGCGSRIDVEVEYDE